MADAFIRTRYITSDKRTSRYDMERMKKDLTNTSVNSDDIASMEKDQRDIEKDFS